MFVIRPFLCVAHYLTLFTLYRILSPPCGSKSTKMHIFNNPATPSGSAGQTIPKGWQDCSLNWPKRTPNPARDDIFYRTTKSVR